MILRMRLRDNSLCEGSGGVVKLPVAIVMFGRRVVFASIPRMVAFVLFELPIHSCMLAHMSGQSLVSSCLVTSLACIDI